jgi:DNA topoisomerase III
LLVGQSQISSGSCQFPTLGFLVENYKSIQDFVAKAFWKIKVSWEPSDEEKYDFVWERRRMIFNQPEVRNAQEVRSHQPVCRLRDDNFH